MTDTRPTLGEYGVKRSLEDVYEMYAKNGDIKDFLYDWGGLNQWLFLQINSIRGDFYDQLMMLITRLGDHNLVHYYIAAIFVYALLSMLYGKLFHKKSIRPRLALWFGVFAVLAVGFAVNGLVVREAKSYFSYDRPYVDFSRSEIHQLEPADKGDEHRTFPSGHTSIITFLIIALWPVFRESWKWYSLLIIAAVGWSRVSLGVHYPADVVGAFLLTTAIIIAVRWVVYTVLRKLFNIIC